MFKKKHLLLLQSFMIHWLLISAMIFKQYHNCRSYSYVFIFCLSSFSLSSALIVKDHYGTYRSSYGLGHGSNMDGGGDVVGGSMGNGLAPGKLS